MPILRPSRRAAAWPACLHASWRCPRLRPGQAESRRHLHRAGGAAVGQPHRQGAEGRRGRGEIEYVFSENVANADYERVMRQYAEKGHTLIVGESFAVEAAARKVAKDYPKVSFLMGSSGKPQEPNFSVFDNYIQEPAYLSGLIAGGVSKSGKIGMVGGFPIPEVNRLMNAFMAGAKEVNPKAELHGQLHQQLVRPAQGQGSRLRHDRQGRRRDVRRALRRQRRGQGAQGAGHRQRDQHPGQVPRHRGGQRAVEHGAHHRRRASRR
jgi:hypothetical protein